MKDFKVMEDLIKNYLSNILEFSFENSNQAIYIMNKNGKVIYSNTTAFTQLGYTLNELLELYVWDIDAVVNTKEKYLEAIQSFHNDEATDKSHVLENYHRKKMVIFSLLK